MKKFGKLIQPKRLMRSFKFNKGNFLHFILAIAGVLLGLYLLSKWTGNFRASEGFEGESKLYFFYADWCPHCTKMKPTWNSLESENLGVSFEKVNCTDNKNVPELAKTYNVSGYPTIIYVNGNNVQEYSGNRTKEDIISFIKSNQ